MAINFNQIADDFKHTNWKDPGTWTIAPKIVVLIAILVRLTGPMPSGRWRAVDRKLGDLTYPLYLTHMPVLIALHHYGLMQGAVGVIVMFITTGLTAAALHFAVERPLARTRTKVRRAALHSKAEATVPAPALAAQPAVNP